MNPQSSLSQNLVFFFFFFLFLFLFLFLFFSVQTAKIDVFFFLFGGFAPLLRLGRSSANPCLFLNRRDPYRGGVHVCEFLMHCFLSLLAFGVGSCASQYFLFLLTCLFSFSFFFFFFFLA
jgi:hypothetical protein